MAFKIYKRGQGYYTRLYSGLIAFLIVATGCFVLHGKLRIYDQILVETVIPVAVCSVLGLFIYWLVNKPNVADFMISAEGEIKKVSWSSRKEIIASTLVVICVVALMAVMLLVADVAFKSLFMYVIKI